MIRSLNFFESKSIDWLALARERTNLSPDIRAGIEAYAHKQSYFCKQMRGNTRRIGSTFFASINSSCPARGQLRTAQSLVRQLKSNEGGIGNRLIFAYLNESATMDVDEA